MLRSHVDPIAVVMMKDIFLVNEIMKESLLMGGGVGQKQRDEKENEAERFGFGLGQHDNKETS